MGVKRFCLVDPRSLALDLHLKRQRIVFGSQGLEPSKIKLSNSCQQVLPTMRICVVKPHIFVHFLEGRLCGGGRVNSITSGAVFDREKAQLHLVHCPRGGGSRVREDVLLQITGGPAAW